MVSEMLKMQTGSGLEVDARQNGLHSPQGTGDHFKYPATNPESSGIKPDGRTITSLSKGAENNRVFGLRQTIFILSILLAVVLALGVTSAALAGHYAAKANR